MIISRSENRLLGLNEGADLMNKEENESIDRFWGKDNGVLCIWSWQCTSQWCDCDKVCKKQNTGDLSCL